MSLSRIGKPTLIVLSLLLALAVLSLAPQPAAPASGGNAIALKAPSFVQVANAQEGTSAQQEPAAAPMGFPQDEAGISAYFKSASPVNLADVRGVYRVIEAQTADYIIGSVAVPNYPESYDVHLYAHREGWFLAYYLAADPIGKIVDWKSYDGTRVPTILEKTLLLTATSVGLPYPGATYYDFRYPNSTHLMLVVEDKENGNEFQINLTGTYGYYERSWSMGTTSCNNTTDGWLYLDGTLIKSEGACGWYTGYGAFTAAQMLPDTFHTMSISSTGGSAYAGLALIYRVP